MTIESIAINYGESRFGRSCGNCNYLDKKIMGNECGLHCLPTLLDMCCGTWSDGKKKEVFYNQNELF